ENVGGPGWRKDNPPIARICRVRITILQAQADERVLARKDRFVGIGNAHATGLRLVSVAATCEYTLAAGAFYFFFAAFLALRVVPLPSLSSALRTVANSSSDALSTRGKRRFRLSSVETTTEPMTTRANHLWSAGTTNHGASFVAVCRIMSW